MRKTIRRRSWPLRSSENIGLAIIGAVPLVFVDVHRLGPGTGSATMAAPHCPSGEDALVRITGWTHDERAFRTKP